MIERALYTHITESSTIAALIGVRLFPNQIPQGQKMPAAVYQQSKGVRQHTMDGPVGMVDSQYSVTCYAESYSQAKSLSEAIRNRLDGYRGTVGGVEIDAIFLIDEFDVPCSKAGTDILNRFGKNLTFIVWFRELTT